MLTTGYRTNSTGAVLLFIFFVLGGPGFAEAAPPSSDGIRGEHRTLQQALVELAQDGGEADARKSCHKETTVEQCASCCRAANQACEALVIPLCHQGNPDRAEFRHCTRDRERRCQTDFDNCAWLCGRVK